MFGFAEKPDVPAALRLHPEALECDPGEASFFLGRETPVPSMRPELSAWQERLYAFMTRNAVAAPDYFLIPPRLASLNSGRGLRCEIGLRRVRGCDPASPERVPVVSRAGRASKWCRRLSFMMPEGPLQFRQCLYYGVGPYWTM